MIDRRFLTLTFLGGRGHEAERPVRAIRRERRSLSPADVAGTSYDPDAGFGFRNPGGVGRVRELYPPGNVFERSGDRVRTARFDEGPAATSRQ